MPLSGSCVDENALLMSEVKEEWAVWLVMTERQQPLKHVVETKTCRVPSMDAQPVESGHKYASAAEDHTGWQSVS